MAEAELLAPAAAVVETLDSKDENVGVTDEDILAVEMVFGGFVFDPDLLLGCSSKLETILGSSPRLCKALESKPVSKQKKYLLLEFNSRISSLRIFVTLQAFEIALLKYFLLLNKITINLIFSFTLEN